MHSGPTGSQADIRVGTILTVAIGLTYLMGLAILIWKFQTTSVTAGLLLLPVLLYVSAHEPGVQHVSASRATDDHWGCGRKTRATLSSTAELWSATIASRRCSALQSGPPSERYCLYPVGARSSTMVRPG